MKPVDLEFRDRQIPAGADDLILRSVVIHVQPLDLLICFTQGSRQSHVLLDQLLDPARFVQLQQGRHLRPLLKQAIALLPQLRESRMALLQLLLQSRDPLVGRREFLGFQLKSFLQIVHLTPLTGDHFVGDRPLGLKIALQIGLILAHFLRLRFHDLHVCL